MQLVVWASLPPWPRLQAPADTSCRRPNQDEGHGLENAGEDEGTGAGLGHHRADDAANQPMRGTAGNAIDPSDHMGVDDARLHNALAHPGGHAQVKHEDGDKVQEGGKERRLRGF
jgi:hypothetical protein